MFFIAFILHFYNSMPTSKAEKQMSVAYVSIPALQIGLGSITTNKANGGDGIPS